MNEESTVRAFSLRVPKELGEKAIRLAASLDLLDRSLQVRSDNGFLYVPLNRRPLPSHSMKLEDMLSQFDVLAQDFSKRTRPPRAAFEAAGDRLPAHLLASFPRSVDLVGDIAVVEVPPELEEHKELVGEAILEAHGHVRTVLAKSSAISGVFRLRDYEVIAGSQETETVHKEHGCRYHLDLRKVYFSPRLSFEHSRVASQVEENETVLDMFAGVGPFSVLIAKTHTDVKIYAIDVNPDAVRYLERNIALNGVVEKVVPILGDVRDVICERLRGTADRVIMNLPEKASEYLEAACQAVKPEGGVIHYYEFARGPDPLETAKDRLVKALGGKNRRIEDFLSARTVREVAPSKWQVALDTRIR